MIIQAVIISFAMHGLFPNGATIGQGLVVSAGFGVFLASYIVLAEPAKYTAPSIPTWMITESLASFVQFAIFGVLLGLIFKPAASTLRP